MLKPLKEIGYEREVLIGKPELVCLHDVLNKWIDINIEYIEKYQFSDAMFWFNERANIGALAGAVWRLGGVALEEYSTIKGKGEGEYKGRNDLYFDYQCH